MQFSGWWKEAQEGETIGEGNGTIKIEMLMLGSYIEREGRWPLLFSLSSSSKENEMGWSRERTQGKDH